MSIAQMQQYDLFLDENDWDIYYWATQSPAYSSSPPEKVGGDMQSNHFKAEPKSPTPEQALRTDAWRQGNPRSGEWAQTVGTFKPAYRPVPKRWMDSEILNLLRKHVRERSAGGVLDDVRQKPKGSGLGRMPDVQVFNS